MPNDSMRTVLVALVSGLGVALAKFGAAAFTGSPALAAEASHSLADTANDLFLLVAQRRSSRPRDVRHPLGFGRESYFWSLIAALGVFVAGAAFSFRQGIAELIHPGTTSSFAVAYVVLAISSVFDLLSLNQSGGQMSRAARRANRTLIDQSAATSDPTLRAVFVEDAVSISGDVLALIGLGLNQITGSSVPQAVAAVLIGLLLIRTSLRLIRRSHDFLLGQPLEPADEQRVRTFLLAYPGVASVSELIVTFIGPGQVWVIARLDIDDELRGDQVTSLVRGLESGLKHESKNIYRVDVVPIGEAQTPTPPGERRATGR
jgi:cation diffusion facilitator family transporter